MGIGAAIAEALARQGARVALVARGRVALNDKVAQIGQRAHAYPCDMRDPEAITAMVASVERDLGPVSILVNNVGAGTFKPLQQIDAREISTTIDLPLGAALHATRAVLPAMIRRGEGHIVNLTSPAGYFPLPYMIPYTTTRHAIVALSASLREEVGRYGIGVSLVCPSEVDTGYFERNDADMGWYPRMSSWFPVLKPEEVARRTAYAILRNRREVIFPWQLALITWLYKRFPVIGLGLLKAAGLFRPHLTPPTIAPRIHDDRC
ncbi:MAG: family NAD(P)-dependent oxidoreductase [Rhodococcus erythropolis]|nr:family NAD(P)-dependent oxidoreductase [Rhodococcus erythropolis]